MTHDPRDPFGQHRPDPGRPGQDRPAASGAPVISNDDLLRFVDGALDDDGRIRVLTHLATRPVAVERIEAYLHQNARLRSLRDHLPIADSAAFAAPTQAAIVARLGRNRRLRGLNKWAAAAAVALVVAGSAAGLTLDFSRSVDEQGQQQATATTSRNAVFLFDQPDLAAALASTSIEEGVIEADGTPDADTVDEAAFAWLAGKLSDFSLRAPDFDRVGLRLVGGDTLDNQGTPAIRLIYRDQAENPVVLHVGIGKPDAAHAFWLVREGYVSLQWRRGPIVFAIVAPTDSPQLSDVVDLVGEAVARLPAPAGPAPAGNEPKETTATGEAATGESGPVQAIAVPATPPAAPLEQEAEPAPPSAVEVIPEVVPKDQNQPEPL
jgi:anti-sigma factor RsiW